MQKFSDTILNRHGKPVAGAVVTVTTYPGNEPAVIYAADGGLPVQSVTSDDTGRFSFYAADGHYNLSIVGKHIDPITVTDVVLNDPADDVTPATYAAADGAAKVGHGEKTVAQALDTMMGLRASSAALPASPVWTPIPQLESDAPLLGGATGILNKQARALADRTEALLASAQAPVNAALVANAASKIRAGTAKIVCLGDSLTYGHDTFSADRVAPVAPHVQSRVPVPYPAKLQAVLTSIYSAPSIVVENRGFSGDTVKSGFTRWTADPTADLVFIMYGINDAATPGGLTLAEYADYMARTILRYNAWGCGVVIMTSTSLNHGNESRNIDPYRATAIELAQKFCCPIFQADGVGLHNTKADIYSDGVHFNSAGYALLGNSVGMFIAAGGLLRDPNVVAADKSVLVGSAANVITNGAYSYSAGAYSRQELLLTLTKNTAQKLTFAFYLDADAADLWLIGGIGTGTSIEIDADSLRSAATRKSVDATTTANYTVTTDVPRLSGGHDILLGRVVGRGWHSLTVSAPSSASAGDNYVSAIRVQPKRQVECVPSVYAIETRQFSIFDPAPTNGTLPPASGANSFSIPRTLLGTLPFKGSGFYISNFLIVEICHFAGGLRSYSRSMVSPVSTTAYSVTLLESAGTNPVTITSVSGSTAEASTGNLVFALDRPAIGFMEMRFTVADSGDMRSAALP